MPSPNNPYASSFASIQNQTVQNKSNPNYMLSTTPHLLNKPAGHSASTSLPLYKRSFQGPFPSISDVNFDLESQNSNNLLVKAVPFKGSAKKVTKKKSTKKTGTKKKSITRKKPTTSVKRKKVSLKKKKTITRKKPVSIKKKKVSIKRKNVSIKRKKVSVKRKTVRKIKGGIRPVISK